MVTVLRRLNGSDILHEYPNLSAYVARGEARPAFKRAFDAQLAVFHRRIGELRDHILPKNDRRLRVTRQTLERNRRCGKLC